MSGCHYAEPNRHDSAADSVSARAAVGQFGAVVVYGRCFGAVVARLRQREGSGLLLLACLVNLFFCSPYSKHYSILCDRFHWI